MKKLISMTDFVFEIGNLDKTTHGENLSSIYNYAIFLKQPLTLGMFIPCDENNIPLKEPVMYYSEENIKRLKGIEIEIANFANNRVKEYQQAKEKCLFENFKFVESNNIGIDSNLDYFVFPYGENRLGLTKIQKGFKTWFQLFTVEDLVQCDLELSKNTIEEF